MNFLARFVKNVRHGFATNSSSSHSLVYLVNPDSAVDDLPYGNEFGWEMFHAFTSAGKAVYFQAQGGSWDSANGYVDHQSVGTLGAKQIYDAHVGVIGGNDNSDSTTDELRSLSAAGVIDLEKTLELGYIDEWEYKRVKEEDGAW